MIVRKTHDKKRLKPDVFGLIALQQWLTLNLTTDEEAATAVSKRLVNVL